MKQVINKSVRAIGEAMVEMAPTERGLYKRGFAGDTFNTAWHMAQWLGEGFDVGLVSRVGQDSISNDFAGEMAADGMNVSGLSRDPLLRMGLYLIERDGVERKFHYWRDSSAARHLADDAAALRAALEGVGLVHLSGITLAILPGKARETLFSALADVRANKGIISFDPNIRPRLWASPSEMQSAVARMLTLTDIALPSLEDELAHSGDRRAADTIFRMKDAGVGEVIVKNGSGPVLVATDDEVTEVSTPVVANICDTTGAGDAFNAGYLAARLVGAGSLQAVAAGQAMAAKTLARFGARASREDLVAMPRPGAFV